MAIKTRACALIRRISRNHYILDANATNTYFEAEEYVGKRGTFRRRERSEEGDESACAGVAAAMTNSSIGVSQEWSYINASGAAPLVGVTTPGLVAVGSSLYLFGGSLPDGEKSPPPKVPQPFSS